MNKKIYLLIITIVAISIGVFSMDVSSDPFEDSQYANTQSTQTNENIRALEGKGYDIVYGSASFTEMSFRDTVTNSNLILRGTIANVEDVTKTDFETQSVDVSTLYTVNVDDVFKGKITTPQIKYTTFGGLNGNLYVAYDQFVYSPGDKVFLFLIEYETTATDKIYTPLGMYGDYKLVNNSISSIGEVHKYGESTVVPLSDFKSIIKNMVG